MKTRLVPFIGVMLAMLVAAIAIVPGALGGSRQATVEAVAPEEESAVVDDGAVFGQAAEDVPANCRFGVATRKNTLQYQWVDDVGAGWWMDFELNYAEPASNGAEFAHLIWVQQDKDTAGNYLNTYGMTPSMEGNILGYLLDHRPGRMWIIGNEVDRGPNYHDGARGQGDTMPQMYARIYHEVYHYIKRWDPTALVTPSALVQFTPGREAYLNKVWDTYKARYGTAMPVDFWNMHLYILPEVRTDGTPNGIAGVALDTDWSLGMKESGGDPAKCADPKVYCLAEHDSMAAFEEQVVRMRTWMKDHGYQNYPLLITEYSLLYRYEQNGGTCSLMDEFGKCFTPPRVQKFAADSFNYLLTAADPDLGYPLDNDRLVQQWMWYGMYRTGDFSVSNLAASGSEPLVLTDAGQLFSNMTHTITPTVNLIAAEAGDQLGKVSDGSTLAKVSVVMRNNGNTRVDDPITVTFYRDEALTQVIGSKTIEAPVPAPYSDFIGMTGCAVRGLKVSVDAVWDEELAPGDYPFWVKVDSGDSVAEDREDDNVASGVLTIVPSGVFLPVVRH